MVYEDVFTGIVPTSGRRYSGIYQYWQNNSVEPLSYCNRSPAGDYAGVPTFEIVSSSPLNLCPVNSSDNL